MIKTDNLYGMAFPESMTGLQCAVHILAPGIDMGFMKPNKPKEYIELSQEQIINLLQNINQTEDYLIGDIFLAGKYPTPDIEMRFNVGEDIRCTGRVIPYTKEEIHEQIQMINTNGKEIMVCGEVHTFVDLGKNLSFEVKTPVRVSIKDYQIHWNGAYNQLPEKYARIFKDYYLLDREYLNLLLKIISLGYLNTLMAWIGIQTLLLNPVVSYRCKWETVPDPNMKSNKSKKGPKKYVKRLTIGDLSDLEFNKSKHQIKEPFWWVSGHWREYKSGKKIFIEGYWKGPFREYGITNAEPREREIVFESDMDKFTKVLNEKIKSGDI